MNLGQIVQSHALSFFHLSGPDLLLGWDSDPARRNVFGLIEADPELARGGIRLRQFGQEIIEALGGKKIHPAWCVPGGVREALSRGAARRTSAAVCRRRGRRSRPPWPGSRSMLDGFQEEARTFGDFPSLLHGPRRVRTAAGNTTTAVSASWTRRASHRRRRARPDALSPSSSARPSSRIRT